MLGQLTLFPFSTSYTERGKNSEQNHTCTANLLLPPFDNNINNKINIVLNSKLTVQYIQYVSNHVLFYIMFSTCISADRFILVFINLARAYI